MSIQQAHTAVDQAPSHHRLHGSTQGMRLSYAFEAAAFPNITTGCRSGAFAIILLKSSTGQIAKSHRRFITCDGRLGLDELSNYLLDLDASDQRKALERAAEPVARAPLGTRALEFVQRLDYPEACYSEVLRCYGHRVAREKAAAGLNIRDNKPILALAESD